MSKIICRIDTPKGKQQTNKQNMKTYSILHNKKKVARLSLNLQCKLFQEVSPVRSLTVKLKLSNIEQQIPQNIVKGATLSILVEISKDA